MFIEVSITLYNSLMALFMFLLLSFFISCYEVDARTNSQMERQYNFAASQGLKSALLTVDNDFDCVDIYKQPAFEHPLLKNHKIQLNPTFSRGTTQRRLPGSDNTINIDHLVEGCPPGKVPIHGINTRHQMSINSSSELEIKDFHQYSQSFPNHHFATLGTTQSMTYHGASAIFNLYNLSVSANQYSLSQIWLHSGPPTELNSIKVGFGVHPSLYGDDRQRLTAYWTADNSKKTGCFNYQCPGFVQVEPTIHLGDFPGESSAEKTYVTIKVKQDQSTGNWWLLTSTRTQDNIQIGYWPKEIFTHLADGASLIRYGGETYSPPNMISPPMGSGQLPDTLFPKSAYFAQLQIIDSAYNENDVHPEDMESYCDTSSDCYGVLYHGDQGPFFRQAFLFGGPGGQCGM